MKNFLQFSIPLLIIIIVGFFFFKSSDPISDDKKLYIKCNNNSKSYTISTGLEIEFVPKDDACKMNVAIINVDADYVKISTPYLWHLTVQGKIDESEPQKVNLIDANEEVTFYSYDRQTKYIFEYK